MDCGQWRLLPKMHFALIELSFSSESRGDRWREICRLTAHDAVDHLQSCFRVRRSSSQAMRNDGRTRIWCTPHRASAHTLRDGTSIGANAEEAQEGQSKADYIAKMCVSSKEARETAYWLRLAIAVCTVNCDEVASELKEANELRFMIRAAIRTARSSTDRGRP